MAQEYHQQTLSAPRVFFTRMIVFLIIVAFGTLILFPQIKSAFMSNPGLNGLIVFTLALGLVYSFNQVYQLRPEVAWINSYRIADPGLSVDASPVLLAPMATMLRDRQGPTSLTTLSMRSLLDSIAIRLDETRDISRYMIGLLIFLGLLGTFWGLLETVGSVSKTIQALDVSTTESSVVFEELKSGLEAPLAGMGTAFSSSLFGLAGSLILGFLDLQASQAQNRFYRELEDWLSTITEIEAADSTRPAGSADMRRSLKRIEHDLARIDPEAQDASQAQTNAGMHTLVAGMQNLIHHMREEQKVVREWAQAQTDNQAKLHKELKDVLSEIPQQEKTTKSKSPRKRP